MSISNLMVLKSAAGYYLGRLTKLPDGTDVPYSRESDYFSSSEIAERHLESMFGDSDCVRCEGITVDSHGDGDCLRCKGSGTDPDTQ